MSLSSLQRESICSASVVLPRAKSWNHKSNLGNGMHEVIESRIHGADPTESELEAVASGYGLVDDELSRFMYLAKTFRPNVPRGSITELAIGLFEDGSVRRVKGGKGEYAREPGLLLPGTIDVAWGDPLPVNGESLRCPDESTLWLADFKTGDEAYVPPIAINWQIRAGALMMAKLTGAKKVIPAICFVDGAKSGQSTFGGQWEIGVPLDETELAKIESDLMALLARNKKSKIEGKRRLKMVTGPQCEYCPCRISCPAHLSEVRALLTGEPVVGTPSLTRDEAIQLAGALPRLRKAVSMAEKAIKLYGQEHGPIDLVDGKVFGPKQVNKTHLSTGIVYKAAYDQFRSMFDANAEIQGGADSSYDEPVVGRSEVVDVLAKSATYAAFKTSKSALYAASAAVSEACGVKKKSAAAAAIMAAVDLAGGKTVKSSVSWSNHWPDSVAPEEDEEDS